MLFLGGAQWAFLSGYLPSQLGTGSLPLLPLSPPPVSKDSLAGDTGPIADPLGTELGTQKEEREKVGSQA